MRKRIFEIIEKSDGNDTLSSIYDAIIIVMIVISLIPLISKSENQLFQIFDKVSVSVFIVDYLLRLLTADYKFGKKSVFSFLRYPFSFMAIIDLLSILPSLTLVSKSLKVLRVFRLFRALKVLRMLRTLKVFRVVKAARYSKSISIILDVFKQSKAPLLAVGSLAVAYIFIAALVIFNVEPDSFNTFFDAIYWATVSLTTVGYGDIYPVTMVGRIVTMVSSIFGIAIVALPAGIITAGYLTAVNSSYSQENKQDEGVNNNNDC